VYSTVVRGSNHPARTTDAEESEGEYRSKRLRTCMDATLSKRASCFLGGGRVIKFAFVVVATRECDGGHWPLACKGHFHMETKFNS
jgi:hypothetical protein